MRFREEIKVGSNVRLRLLDKPGGRVVEQRESHNIFVNYGREWIAELTAYETTLTPFREDRIRYMSVGIGGTAQQLSVSAIQGLGYNGYLYDGSGNNTWDYASPFTTLDTGGYATGNTTGVTGAVQTDQDADVTGLEYPVQIAAPTASTPSYYNEVKAPTSFPTAGIVRFTGVLGYSDVSFGAATSVPLSEIGLFTGSASEGVTDTVQPPLDSNEQRDPTAGGPPFYPAIGTRYMVAYNTFSTLSKTNAFVLQVDWELRFS